MSKRDLSRLVILTLLLAPQLVAQEVAPQSLPYVVTGEQLPKYVLVEQFFLFAQSACNQGEVLKRYFYEQIGLEVGGAADEAFTEALVAARELFFPEGQVHREVSESPDGRVDVIERSVASPAAETMSDIDVAEYERQKVRRLAQIYSTLESELRDAGATISGIDLYIQKEIASSSWMATDQAPEEDVLGQELDTLFNTLVSPQL